MADGGIKEEVRRKQDETGQDKLNLLPSAIELLPSPTTKEEEK